MNEFKSFYKTVSGNEGNKCHYATRLDLYGCGCCHDCSYCYAKSLLSFRGVWNAEEPAIADIEKVKARISKIAPGSVVRLGDMTDCFQVAERKEAATYKAIKEMNKRKIHYLIVTKSDLVVNPAYMEAMDKELAHIQVSITATDDSIARCYEKAPAISARIKAIETLQRNGFDVQVRLSPFIPDFIDYDKLNAIECDKILVEFLRVNHWIKQWFDIDYSEYTLKHSGYLHLPLEKKVEYLKNITGFKQVSVCDDVDEHFAYWKENYNSNPNDCCNLRIEREEELAV